MTGADLEVGWCSTTAAEFACHRWHYSGTLVWGKRTTVGVWERGQFVGCVVVGEPAVPGAAQDLRTLFDLDRTQVSELTRVALRGHESPTSQIVSRSIDLIRTRNPGLRLLVSYADPYEGHVGGIYQAMNWTYLGETSSVPIYIERSTGRPIHARVLNHRHGTKKLDVVGHLYEREMRPGKYRYALGLDRAIRRRLAGLARPYPKKEP